MNISGLLFRTDDTSLVRGAQIQTFMVGEFSMFSPFVFMMS